MRLSWLPPHARSVQSTQWEQNKCILPNEPVITRGWYLDRKQNSNRRDLGQTDGEQGVKPHPHLLAHGLLSEP